jgi:hypothetical protein
MNKLSLLVACGCCLLILSGCQDDVEQSGPESSPDPPTEVTLPPTVAGPASAIEPRIEEKRVEPSSPAEPRIPEPEKLIELLPADARQLLRDHQVAAEMFGDIAFVPGSFVARGETATARVRQRVSGYCFIHHRAPEGWLIWSRPPAPRRPEANRQPLHGVAPEVVTAEGLVAWLRAEPKRFLTLKVGDTSGFELAALAGIRIDDDDFVGLEAEVTPQPEVPGVFRLALATLGRELPVELDVTRRDGGWEVTAVRRVAGMSTAAFLRTILERSRP